MPELPEVETVVRGLAACVTGSTIERVEVFLERVVSPPPAVFVAALAGRRITACRRRAKFIVFDLSDGRQLTVHLRMTGRFYYLPAGTPADEPVPYQKVKFGLSSGAALVFADARTFGRLCLVNPGEAWDGKLGPEPLSSAFTPEYFSQLVSGSRKRIKSLLLDQAAIAGIGNIYACEMLWQAQIHPETLSHRLRKQHRIRLYEALRDVLARAIELRGTSAKDYVDVEGMKGGFQNVLAVYGRHGRGCPRCGHAITREVVAQRGTWLCSRCQVFRP